FLGMLLQYIFGIIIPIFDPVGNRSAAYNDPPFFTGFFIIDALLVGDWLLVGDYLYHMTLPVFCLSFIIFASITRQSRSSMLDQLHQDYVRTARAKGCREKEVVHKHALQNALIPTVTLTGINFASAISGAFFLEITFGLNGMGKLFLDAILLTDYWVLNTIVFLITMVFILINLFADIIYAKIDPRIRYS
ncbi:MAG: ABC transporter permease, partial [Promethearchaeota archaeon]